MWGRAKTTDPRARRAFQHLPRLLPLLRPHWRLALASVSLIGASVLIGLAAPWPLALVIDTVIGDKPLPGPLQAILGGLGTYGVLAVIVAAGFLLAVLSYGLAIIDNYVNTKLNLRLTLDFRSQLYGHVQRLSPAFHDRVPAGQVMFRLNQQANSVGMIVTGFPPFAQSLITVVGMVTITALLDWQLALISIAVVPLIIFSAQYYTRRIEPQLYEVRNLESRAQSTIHEAVAMFRVVLAFGRERHEYRRWQEQAQHSNQARLRLTLRQTSFSLVVGAITALGTALVLGFGAASVLRGRLTVGELTVFLGYVASMYKPLQQSSASLAALQQQLVSFDTARELLRVPPDVHDAPDAIEANDVKGGLTFEDVHFDYSEMPVARLQAGGNGAAGLLPVPGPAGQSAPGRSFLDDPVIAELAQRARQLGLTVEKPGVGRGQPALTGISFDVAPGQQVAVVGPTGAGKTTLMNLLIRFYDPTRGIIRLDGVDLRRFKVASLRQQISVVLQEPMLFAGTIGDNIRYANPEATDAQVISAARAANIHDFIASLPDEYDTMIGERGSQLSGGERQRISVARAFLKDAPVLLLDEPTSSIDSRTEAVVLDALERLVEGRTTFTVAHRLSTVRRADLIVVMDGGRLVATGDHESLMAAGGLYAQLYNAQLGRAESDVFNGSSEGTAVVPVPPIARTFSSLVVAAVADVLESGSTTRLGELIARMPAPVRIPAWWLLIGAVFAVLRDDSDLTLRSLAKRRQIPDPRGQLIGHLAAHLLRERDVLRRIHERLRLVATLDDCQPLASDTLLSAPWEELKAAYPEASRVLGDVLPTRERV